MQIKSQATRSLDDCRNKLFRYMRENNIKPYGNIVEFRKGFKMWGEKIENGKASSNLYYVDYECIAKWRGNRIGWIKIPKGIHNKIETSQSFKDKQDEPINEYVPTAIKKPKNRIKAIVNGVETIYENAKECSEALDIDAMYIYQRSNSGKSYKGMYFEKIRLIEE